MILLRSKYFNPAVVSKINEKNKFSTKNFEIVILILEK